MATTAHSIYCFEALVASLEKRNALTLKQVEDLWEQYERRNDTPEGQDGSGLDDNDEDAEMTDGDQEELEEGDKGKGIAAPTPSSLLPRDISRLQASSPASASTSSTPSTLSANSSQAALRDASKSSSKTSFFSFSRKSPASPVKQEEEHPLFVTWNTVSSRGSRRLRGCLGSFDAHELSSGLRSYTLASAFDDVRFSPIDLTELPHLAISVTLLMNFAPCADPLDWDIGTHGLRISFTHHGKRYGSTYLPDVAPEQGWTKEETITSLMRKAGWSGRSSDWKKMSDLRCIRYEGMQASVGYTVWKEWRDWVRSSQDKA